MEMTQMTRTSYPQPMSQDEVALAQQAADRAIAQLDWLLGAEVETEAEVAREAA
jgi:hypothetical protein